MNMQEIFDKAVGGVVAQGGPSSGVTEELTAVCLCLYRGDNGRKCAVGHLIDDSAYSSELEGQNVSDEKVRWAVENSVGRELSRREVEMLVDLQAAHDQGYGEDFPEYIPGFLYSVERIADDYNLEMKDYQ